MKPETKATPVGDDVRSLKLHFEEQIRDLRFQREGATRPGWTAYGSRNIIHRPRTRKTTRKVIMGATSSQKSIRDMTDNGGRILKTEPQALHWTFLARPALSSMTARMPPPKRAVQLKELPSLRIGLWPVSAPQAGQGFTASTPAGIAAAAYAGGGFAISGVWSMGQTVAWSGNSLPQYGHVFINRRKSNVQRQRVKGQNSRFETFWRFHPPSPRLRRTGTRFAGQPWAE
jgi:hypothetical protein